MDIPTSPVLDLARDIFVGLVLDETLRCNCDNGKKAVFAFDAAEAFVRVADERGAVASEQVDP